MPEVWSLDLAWSFRWSKRDIVNFSCFRLNRRWWVVKSYYRKRIGFAFQAPVRWQRLMNRWWLAFNDYLISLCRLSMSSLPGLPTYTIWLVWGHQAHLPRKSFRVAGNSALCRSALIGFKTVQALGVDGRLFIFHENNVDSYTVYSQINIHLRDVFWLLRSNTISATKTGHESIVHKSWKGRLEVYV